MRMGVLECFLPDNQSIQAYSVRVTRSRSAETLDTGNPHPLAASGYPKKLPSVCKLSVALQSVPLNVPRAAV